MRERAFVGGRWIEATGGGSIAVRNPAGGTILGQLPDCGRPDVAEAIAAAKVALPAWRARTAKDRDMKYVCMGGL